MPFPTYIVIQQYTIYSAMLCSSMPAVSQIESTVNRKPKSAPHQQWWKLFSFGVAHTPMILFPFSKGQKTRVLWMP